MGVTTSKIDLSTIKTAAGLSSIHDIKVVEAVTTAQVGLHIGKNEQVTKKDIEKKVEEIGKKRGI